MLYCTVQALGEMAVAFPVTGSFSTYSTRFLDPAWGFAMGWNYAMNWLIVLPLEIVAASITIEYWNTSMLMNGLWVTIFLLIIVGINLFGVKGYGEAEFVFSIIKITAIIGFMCALQLTLFSTRPAQLTSLRILGIVLNIAGGPDGTYIGGQYWHSPGAFHNGFKGLCSTFVTAAFAFAGTELVGLTAAETSNPRKTLPTAIKQVFWRICIFYIVSLTLIGLLIPYTDPRLIGSNNHDTRASPFVIAISNAGIQGLDSVMNGVIMLAVLSVGNSAVYGSSRTLAALAEQNQAPRFLAYIDRRGRPLVAITLAASLGLLAYLATSAAQEEAFAWMLAVCGLSSIFTWGSICLAHIRFRAAWRYNGRGLEALAFRSQCGVAGSWVGLVFTILVLAAQFWTGFAPIGWQANTRLENLRGFFQAYLAAPVVLACYAGYKIWFRTRIMRTRDVDLATGMREVHLPELVGEEEGLRQAWPRWKKVYKFLC